MPLFKWELAEVAMVEGVQSGGRPDDGWVNRSGERGGEEMGERAVQTLCSTPILRSAGSLAALYT